MAKSAIPWLAATVRILQKRVEELEEKTRQSSPSPPSLQDVKPRSLYDALALATTSTSTLPPQEARIFDCQLSDMMFTLHDDDLNHEGVTASEAYQDDGSTSSFVSCEGQACAGTSIDIAEQELVVETFLNNLVVPAAGDSGQDSIAELDSSMDELVAWFCKHRYDPIHTKRYHFILNEHESDLGSRVSDYCDSDDYDRESTHSGREAMSDFDLDETWNRLEQIVTTSLQSAHTLEDIDIIRNQSCEMSRAIAGKLGLTGSCRDYPTPRVRELKGELGDAAFDLLVKRHREWNAKLTYLIQIALREHRHREKR